MISQASTHILRVNCAEMAGNRPRQPAYEIKLMLSRVSQALLADISCVWTHRVEQFAICSAPVNDWTHSCGSYLSGQSLLANNWSRRGVTFMTLTPRRSVRTQLFMPTTLHILFCAAIGRIRLRMTCTDDFMWNNIPAYFTSPAFLVSIPMITATVIKQTGWAHND